MKRLIDYTKILRSKNAGPLFITFDLIFPDESSFNYVKEKLTKEIIKEVYDVNIEDISQTIMQGCFTMIMLINLENSKVSFKELAETANGLGDKIGVKIILQNEDIFNAMHRI